MNARGFSGERRALETLSYGRKLGVITAYSRPDWVVVPASGSPFFLEIKDQDHFEGPPFDGHGLPLEQVERYELLRERSGLRTRLVVWEGRRQYSGWVDELERGRRFITPEKARVVYPIGGFERRSL